MKNPKCNHIKEDGNQCGAFAIGGRPYCWYHDPDLAEERSRVGRIGGKKSKIASTKVLTEDTPDVLITSAQDIEALISVTISQVRRGDIAPNVSNAITLLINSWIKIREVCDIEDRLKRLEESSDNDSTQPLFVKTG
ncbi:MAG: hypothetical protein V3V99_01625 [candidate division Zixibacteria bacterium]